VMATPVSVHPVFAAALSGLHENFKWHELVHLGGPVPVVPRRAQAEIALWCAAQLAPLLEGERADPYRELLTVVRNDVTQWTTQRVRVIRNAFPPGDDAETMAQIAAASAQHLRSDVRNASRSARAAARLLARVVSGRRLALKPAAYLRSLDERLMRSELEAGVRKRTKEVPQIRRIVYRGDGVVVAQLETAWGSLVRRHGFHWTAGDIDEVLAVVPDDHFEAAADAAALAQFTAT